jgi:IS30 family transposase
MNNQPRKCLEFMTPAEVFYGGKIVNFVALGD